MKASRNILFTIILLVVGSLHAIAQVLPTYDNIVVDPASGSTVAALSTVTIDLSREGYDAPIGIMPGAGAIQLNSGETTLDNEIKASVKAGKLTLTITPAITENMDVTISIPSGMTNNLPMPVATMSQDELIEEGYCTTPAIDLSYTIAPEPVKYLYSINLNARTFYNDGKATEADIYLDDAKIDINSFWGVTWVDLVFEKEFVNTTFDKALYKTISVRNLTLNKQMSLTAYPMRDEIVRGNTLRLFLSGDNYINVSDRQGEYEIIFPEGIARTADGLPNQAVTIHFTYGNPASVGADNINIEHFLGDYKVSTVAGESTYGIYVKTMTLAMDANGDLSLTGLGKSGLTIPIVKENGNYIAKATTNGSSSFCSVNGGDAGVTFTTNGGKNYILIDASVITVSGKEYEFGDRYYEQTSLTPPPATAIESVREQSTVSAVSYNLDGTRTYNNGASGIRIINGRKYRK